MERAEPYSPREWYLALSVTVLAAAGIATLASVGAVDDAEAQAVSTSTGTTAPVSSSGGRRALRVMPIGRPGAPPGYVL
jgi:hypothetical protein